VISAASAAARGAGAAAGAHAGRARERRRHGAGPGAARGAPRVARDGHRQEPHGQRVDHEQPPDERLAGAEQQLERLGGLQHPDEAGEDAEHPALRAARHRALGRGGREEAAVARPAGRGEHAHLPLEPVDAAVHVGDARRDARVVHGVARGEVVGAVDHEVVAGDEGRGVGGREARAVGLDAHVGVEVAEAAGRRVELGAADVGRAVEHLAVQVAGVHPVVVDQAERADAGGREVERDRRTEPAGAHHQHARALEPTLALGAHGRQQHLARVPVDLVGRERGA
jgi:hypothetical protein